MTLAEYTTVNFIRNSASQFGGAVYIDSSPSLILAENNENNNLWCFYGPLTDTSSFKHITLNFLINTAGKGGDQIYGISVKNYCKINLESIEDPWKHVFNIEPNTTLSAVASDVLCACVCDVMNMVNRSVLICLKYLLTVVLFILENHFPSVLLQSEQNLVPL